MMWLTAPAVAFVALLGVVEGKSKFGGIVIKGNPTTGQAPQLAFGVDAQCGIASTGSALLFEAGSAGAQLDVTSERVAVGKMNLAGNLSVASALTVDGMSQWKLQDIDTFDSDSKKWAGGTNSFCGSSSDLFLGGHCKFGATTTTREYDNLPPHTKVKVTARVHYFDQWKGESVSMSLDDKPTWSQAHHWCPQFLKWTCMKYGVNSCGRDSPDRLSTQVSSTLSHTGSTLKVSFGSTLAKDTDPCYVSWGVDDVAIYLS